MAETKVETLIRSLVAPLIKHPEALSITESNDSKYHRYVVDVASDDVGRVIGRQGCIATALRTIVEGAVNRRPNTKRVRLLINDHRH